MKILLSWLLDYIDCSIHDLEVENLVHVFNIRTAEIESFERVAPEYSSIFVAQVEALGSAGITLVCPELATQLSLPVRSDAVVGKWYLVMKTAHGWRWVVLADFNAEKEGIFPAVHLSSPDDEQGGWKKKVTHVDYVLDVDNKSINHRPDLWGHAGIAREIAAFLKLPFKSLEKKLSAHPVASYPSSTRNPSRDGISIEFDASPSCSRFAALVCNGVICQDSDLIMAIRLACVGAKPINAIIDITNYVMFDLGQPMHVFDAQSFPSKTMVVRHAQQTESLELLDGQIVKLNAKDVVVANEQHPVSLAGIMGGLQSSYQCNTKNIVLEAAGFDPLIIRKTAQRLKLRTEASMRFEKHLDPMQNISAIQKFLYLGHQLGVLPTVIDYPIVSAGVAITPKSCAVAHDFIQSRLGMKLTSEFVIDALKKLHFDVTYHDGVYHVIVPTYRATKDINIAEDIVEEVIRLYGFEKIVPQMPMRQTVPFSLQATENIRSMKRQLAYGLGMHELRDYMMYDASWVSRLKVDVLSSIRVKSPLSENWTTLVTSLIPHLLKAVEHNSVQNDHLRFFEYGRTWHQSHDQYREHKSLAGIIFDKKSVDFYAGKSELQSLWNLLGIEVVYQKPQGSIPEWYDRHQSAELVVDGNVIGHTGMMSVAWMHHVVQGSAFIFEIQGFFLESIKANSKKFTPWSKFQEVTYDISLFTPLAVSSDVLCRTIQGAHPDIKQAHVVDFFEKPEWNEHRAITVRYRIANSERTMTKQDLDMIVQSVHEALKVHDVQIR